MHVMPDRAHVVEEFAQQVPSALALDHIRAQQKIARRLHSLLEKKPFPSVEPHITQPLIWQGLGTIGSFRRRAKPALIDAAAVSSECVQIIGMQLQPSA